MGHPSKIQLHAFSDAVKNAYASCIYIRSILSEETYSYLLYARNRLRPKRMPVSIPRMELLGVVIAVRALKFV